MIWIIGFITILVLLLFLLFSSITISNHIIYERKRLVTTHSLCFYRVCFFKKSYTYDFSNINEKRKQEEFTQNNFRKFIILKKNILHILKKGRINNFSWQTNIGTSEASSTALLVGGLWSVKGTVLAMLCNHNTLQCEPVVMITPHFNKSRLKTDLSCIVTLGMGQAIVSYFRIIRSNSRRNF